MADWINPLTTLVAAFAGAFAAFKLQSVEKASELERTNIAAANRALLTLMQQANTLKLYQTDHITPHRDHPGRHLAIRPTLPYELERLRFDFGALGFFDTPKEQQLLFELSVEERRYIEALRAINSRSELMLLQVDPKLKAAGFLDGGSYSRDDLIAALGQPLYNQLERLTNDVVYHVDRTNDSLLDIKDKLLAASRDRFPGIKFVDFEFHVQRSAP